MSDSFSNRSQYSSVDQQVVSVVRKCLRGEEASVFVDVVVHDQLMTEVANSAQDSKLYNQR